MLKANRSVAVLGAGVSGLHLALIFQEAGYSVTVFSTTKEKPASLASHGLVCHKGYTLPRDELFDDKLSGTEKLRKRIQKLELSSGQRIPFNQGALELFRDDKEEASLRQRVYHRQFTGGFQSEFLLKNSLMPRAPGFFDKTFCKKAPASAYSYPLAFAFDPLVYLDLLKSDLKSKGVLFQELELSGLEVQGEKFLLWGEGKKQEFSHVLCALGAKTEDFLSGTPFSLNQPLSLSFGATLRVEGSHDFASQSFLLRQKNVTFLKKTMILGSFKEVPKKEQILSLFPGFFGDFFEDFLSSPAFFTGNRVYTRSRSPLLQQFQLDSGSKLIVLTGMYKSGFSLSEIFAERALSLF